MQRSDDKCKEMAERVDASNSTTTKSYMNLVVQDGGKRVATDWGQEQK